MNEQLLKNVLTELGFDSIQDEYAVDTMREVLEHGANCGFSGFIYYYETTEFFDSNKKEIIDLVKEYASEFDIGVLELIASFNCLNGDYLIDEIGEVIYGNIDNDAIVQVKNALALFSLEECAREIIDAVENAINEN